MARVAAMSCVVSTISFAGAGSSGGGGSIVCFMKAETLNKVRSQGGAMTATDLAPRNVDFIEAYDLYQAKAARDVQGTEKRPPFDILSTEGCLVPAGYNGMPPDYGAYIERLAARFDHTVPVISDLIREAAKERKQANVAYANGVAQVDDAYPIINPPDASRCALFTTAVQHEDGDQLYITFDRMVMNHPKNSQLSRAVLNLHEELYHLARDHAGHANSLPTRDFLAEILPEHIVATSGEMLRTLTHYGLDQLCLKGGCNGFRYTLERTASEQLHVEGTYFGRLARNAMYDLADYARSRVQQYDQFNRSTIDVEGQQPKDTLLVQWVDQYTRGRTKWVLESLPEFWVRKKGELEQMPDLDPQWVEALDLWARSARVLTIQSDTRLWRTTSGGVPYPELPVALDEVKIGEFQDYSGVAEALVGSPWCDNVPYCYVSTVSVGPLERRKAEELWRFSQANDALFEGPVTLNR